MIHSHRYLLIPLLLTPALARPEVVGNLTGARGRAAAVRAVGGLRLSAVPRRAASAAVAEVGDLVAVTEAGGNVIL